MGGSGWVGGWAGGRAGGWQGRGWGWGWGWFWGWQGRSGWELFPLLLLVLSKLLRLPAPSPYLPALQVRQAEMEGEYLEAKRQLARIREKNLGLARRLADLREAAERGDPLPLTPRAGADGGGGPVEEGLAGEGGERGLL